MSCFEEAKRTNKSNLCLTINILSMHVDVISNNNYMKYN